MTWVYSREFPYTFPIFFDDKRIASDKLEVKVYNNYRTVRVIDTKRRIR